VIFLVKATVVENETLVDLGTEGMARVDVARLAEREQLLPWSRSKLTAAHMLSARNHYDEALTLTGEAREDKMAEALYCVDLALHMNPSMVDALALKEQITGEAAYIKYEESIVNQTYDAVLDAEMKALGIEALPEPKPEAELPELPTSDELIEPEPLSDASDNADAQAEPLADAQADADAEPTQAEADAAWLEKMLADEFGESSEPAAVKVDASEELADAAEDAEATDSEPASDDEDFVAGLDSENASDTEVIVIEPVADESTEQADAPESDEEDIVVVELDEETPSDNTTAGVETD
ncbi:MAG: hypothetical protein ACPGYV_11330, partial [Phycisphaeraceae bacterium]